jgi:hypothetical protein
MPTTRQIRYDAGGADPQMSEQVRPISDDGKARRFAGHGIDDTETASFQLWLPGLRENG